MADDLQPCHLSRRQLALSDGSWPILLKNSFLLEQKKFQGFLEQASVMDTRQPDSKRRGYPASAIR
jgi:hypothetical protein